MACADDTLDDFWKFVLNENEEDSREGKRRWFSRKRLQKSEGDSYSDQRDEDVKPYTETIENQIERAFDSLFYEEPKVERPRRFNWFRQKNSPEPEERGLGGMTIFAPAAGAGTAGAQDLANSNSWFSAGDERNEMMRSSQRASKISSIFDVGSNDDSLVSQKSWFAQEDRNEAQQSPRIGGRKEKVASIFADDSVDSSRQ